ncbi:MAG: tRNA pseudouridine(13) synthase TruD [Nanoarchaeota archaeon]
MLLKSKPEDFIVEEINDLHLHESGSYSYYKLKKTNLETNSALQKIADLWKINPKYINIAGNKDKVAITTQFLSISKGPEKDLKTENLELTFLGKKNDRLNLGTLDGNKFTITVRKISAEERINLLKNTQRADFLFVNYYDDQRFGIEKNNHILGKLLVKKQFKEAAELVCKRDHYPYTEAKKWQEKYPNDSIGILRTLPKKLLLMFVFSYQSWLWNETAKQYVAVKLGDGKYSVAHYNLGELFFPTEKLENKQIPLIGFDVEHDDEDVQQIIAEIMTQEQITERDFLIKQMPEVTASGGKRMLLSNCSDFSSKEIDGETMEFTFTLGKGSYATMVIKQLFC